MRGRCFSLAGMRSKLVAAQYLIGSVDELVAAHSPERRQRDLIEVGDRPEFGRLPYFPEDVVAALSTAAPLVLVGTKSPVAFFGYREHPSALAEGVATLTLSTGEEDSYAALVALDEELSGLPVGASTATVSVGGQTAALSDEQGLDGWTIGSVAAETMPEDAIVSIEGGTVGHSFFAASQNGPRHSVLTNAGGAIGQGLPVALVRRWRRHDVASSRFSPMAVPSTRFRHCGRWPAKVLISPSSWCRTESTESLTPSCSASVTPVATWRTL